MIPLDSHRFTRAMHAIQRKMAQRDVIISLLFLSKLMVKLSHLYHVIHETHFDENVAIFGASLYFSENLLVQYFLSHC